MEETKVPAPPYPWTSQQVCDQVGCTYRQLDYWTRTGRVPDVRMLVAGLSNNKPVRVFDAAAVRMVRKLKKRSDDLRKGLGVANG